ncbi:MAG: glycosyltransferase family 9 protein [Verrucomicrobiae bacterium]|nr:glycosyltransferase family 9 protein [Verrucomicrobiae bacterium]
MPPVTHSPSAGRILVVRGGALGDFILTLPVLAALREGFPGNRIEVLGYSNVTDLAVRSGMADAARSIESRPLAGFFARGGELDPSLSAYFAGFHLIISFLFDPDLIFRTNVGRISQAGFIQGPHRPDESLDRHATDQLLQPLQQLAVFDPDAIPRIPRRPGDHSDTRAIAVHPGSGSERKNWPEDRWAGLLSELAADSERRFLLIGGEAEGDRLERLAGVVPTSAVEILRSRPLAEVSDRLSACRGFLGHDSGITHLAAALGLPGIVLWGPSRLRVWHPRCARMEIIEAGDRLEELSVATVARRVRERLPDWD